MFASLRLFFCGLCMGSADLIPGISGGTIAFIMGFYEDLITSLKSFSVASARFLVPLVCGIATAFILLAEFFHSVLGDPVYRVYLYAAFFGLVVASFIYCAKQLDEWRWKHIAALAVGAVIAHVLTGTTLAPDAVQPHSSLGIDMWLVVCGAIAITAMLLPGISGSYLLTLLGVYAVVISALVDFIEGMKHLTFDQEAFLILFSLFVGIVIGLLLFVRSISYLLKHYHAITIAALVGFMIGSLRSVWPFWSYKYVLDPLKPAKGPRLQPVDIILPDWSTPLVWKAILFAVAGFALVFLIEKLANREKKLGKNPVKSV